jgi:DNA-binding transcriptional ArsR family regulator
MAGKTKTAAMERLFQGLADRTRLRLLNLMADQEVCVWRICAVQAWWQHAGKASGCTTGS